MILYLSPLDGMADIADLKSADFGRTGSSPVAGIYIYLLRLRVLALLVCGSTVTSTVVTAGALRIQRKSYVTAFVSVFMSFLKR